MVRINPRTWHQVACYHWVVGYNCQYAHLVTGPYHALHHAAYRVEHPDEDISDALIEGMHVATEKRSAQPLVLKYDPTTHKPIIGPVSHGKTVSLAELARDVGFKTGHAARFVAALDHLAKQE